MKLISLFIALTLSAMLPKYSGAQAISTQATGEQLVNDTTAKLTSFTAKYNTGKIYLKWTVVNQQVDGLYLVYRSTDGINYENIGNKQGVGVTIAKEIAYYFIDGKPATGTAHYKIVHVGGNKTFLYSERVLVCSDNTELVSK